MGPITGSTWQLRTVLSPKNTKQLCWIGIISTWFRLLLQSISLKLKRVVMLRVQCDQTSFGMIWRIITSNLEKQCYKDLELYIVISNFFILVLIISFLFFFMSITEGIIQIEKKKMKGQEFMWPQILILRFCCCCCCMCGGSSIYICYKNKKRKIKKKKEKNN